MMNGNILYLKQCIRSVPRPMGVCKNAVYYLETQNAVQKLGVERWTPHTLNEHHIRNF